MLATPAGAVEFESEPLPAPQVKPLLERPGLYTALAGAVLLSLGLQFGTAAASVGSRIRDANGDGLIDVTRAELMAAQQQLALATVIGTAGVLGMGAGVGWLILDGQQSTAGLQFQVLAHVAF